jgi:glycosyltransferase involved in cell wall biosynthesis
MVIMKKLAIITTIDITITQFIIPSARLLQENNIEVTLISSMSENFIDKFSNEFKLINVPMERGANIFGLLKGIFQMHTIFKNNKYDMIQYATPNAAFYSSIAGYFNKVPVRLYNQWGIRYVGFDGVKRKLFKLIEKTTCLLSTDIRAVSFKNMAFAISEKNYNPNKVKVVGAGGAVGINLKHFDINKKEEYKEEILEKHTALRGKFVFGFVGRLDKDKGINELLRAYKHISTIKKNCALVIVGPKDKSSRFETSLLLEAEKNENIVFTGFTNEVNKYLSIFDIMVHPSYREGFSLVIQQAMAMCVPVVTTNIPGPSEVIEENKSGLLAEAKDSEDLYKKMSFLMENEMLRNEFSINGLERVKKLFQQEKMSNLILEDRLALLSKNKI